MAPATAAMTKLAPGFIQAEAVPGPPPFPPVPALGRGPVVEKVRRPAWRLPEAADVTVSGTRAVKDRRPSGEAAAFLAQKLTDMQDDLKGKSVLQDLPAHLTPDFFFFFRPLAPFGIPTRQRISQGVRGEIRTKNRASQIGSPLIFGREGLKILCPF